MKNFSDTFGNVGMSDRPWEMASIETELLPPEDAWLMRNMGMPVPPVSPKDGLLLHFLGRVL